MARAKPRPRPKPPKSKTQRTPVTEAVAPPPPPPVAAPVDAEEREGRGATIAAIAIAVLCAGATALLLSGWTPGPHQSAPPRVAARIAPAAPKKVATPRKKTVKPSPRAQEPAKPAKRAAPLRFAAALFAGECGFCHTLSAAGTTGTAGPNLDKLRPSETRVVNAIAAGGRRTGLMPPGILGGSDARRVAKFVAEATRR